MVFLECKFYLNPFRSDLSDPITTESNLDPIFQIQFQPGFEKLDQVSPIYDPVWVGQSH